MGRFELVERIVRGGYSEVASLAPGGPRYRAANDEVDVVLENSSGRLVGVEVKATASPTMADFSGLRAFAEATGPAFHRGVLLHAGAATAPFGDRMWAMPVGALWGR